MMALSVYYLVSSLMAPNISVYAVTYYERVAPHLNELLYMRPVRTVV
jgi:hypothetical protein